MTARDRSTCRKPTLPIALMPACETEMAPGMVVPRRVAPEGAAICAGIEARIGGARVEAQRDALEHLLAALELPVQ